MADSEGESPDFGELEPLGEELKPLDEDLKPLDEEAGESSLAGLEAEDLIPPDFESLLSSETVAPDAAEEPALETAPMVEVVAEDAGAATEKAEEPGAEGPAEEKPEEEPAEKEAKPAGKLMAYLDWVIAGGVAAGLLLLALVGLLNLSTAIYAVSVVAVVSAIWKARQTNDLYTVMLGCATSRHTDGDLLSMAGGGPLSVRREGAGSQAARQARPGCRVKCRLPRLACPTVLFALLGEPAVAPATSPTRHESRRSKVLCAARQGRNPGVKIVGAGSRAVEQRGQINRGLDAAAAEQNAPTAAVPPCISPL